MGVYPNKEVIPVYANYNKCDGIDVKICRSIMAQTYKGFGSSNQTQNGVIEIKRTDNKDLIQNIKKYGNKNSCYKPFDNAVFYPLRSQDFIRTGFMTIAPTLSARDYKDPKCVIEILGDDKRRQ